MYADVLLDRLSCIACYETLLGLTREYNEVYSLKESLNGNDLSDSFVTYIGDGLDYIAPAYTTRNIPEAVEQMEEGLKEVGKKLVDTIKKYFKKFVDFLKRIIGFFKKSKGTMETLDDIIKSDKTYHWKKDADLSAFPYFEDKINADELVNYFGEPMLKMMVYIHMRQYEHIKFVSTPPTLKMITVEDAMLSPVQYAERVKPLIGNDIITLLNTYVKKTEEFVNSINTMGPNNEVNDLVKLSNNMQQQIAQLAKIIHATSKLNKSITT